MTAAEASNRRPPPTWQVALTWGVIALCTLTGAFYLRSIRAGAPSSPLPAGHVALAWHDWVYLAAPAPGTNPSIIAPSNPEDLGKVALTRTDLGLLAGLKRMMPDTQVIAAAPDPFGESQPPTVPGVWAPLADLRAEAEVSAPLVVFMRTQLYLTPFQTALSWSDPRGRLIIVSLEGLGEEPAEILPRLAKILRHEYGHLAGCSHRDGCVMTAVESPAELDQLPEDFCGDCAAAIGDFPFKVPAFTPVIRQVDPTTGQPTD